MKPELEIYLHTCSDWLTEERCEQYLTILQELLPELLAQPKGVEHVLSELDLVELNIVDDPTITDIHAEYLDDPTPTDVITFPYGEIFVSLDTAERYASQNSLHREEELLRYLIHGLVHLHGYLDATPEQRAELFAVQEPLVELALRHSAFQQG